jgi:hypothetical protein
MKFGVNEIVAKNLWKFVDPCAKSFMASALLAHRGRLNPALARFYGREAPTEVV